MTDTSLSEAETLFHADFDQHSEVFAATLKSTGTVHRQWSDLRLVTWTLAANGYLLRTIYSAQYADHSRQTLRRSLYNPDGSSAAVDWAANRILYHGKLTLFRIQLNEGHWLYANGLNELEYDAQTGSVRFNQQPLPLPHDDALWALALNADHIHAILSRHAERNNP